MASMPTEQRQHARAPLELHVRYRRLNSFFADYTRNISRGGTFIETGTPLPLGTRFVLELTVPGRAEPFALSGEVIHAGARDGAVGMGIRFLWDDDAARIVFEEMVEGLMDRALGAHVSAGLLRGSRR